MPPDRCCQFRSYTAYKGTGREHGARDFATSPRPVMSAEPMLNTEPTCGSTHNNDWWVDADESQSRSINQMT